MKHVAMALGALLFFAAPAFSQTADCCAANGTDWGKVGGNYGNHNYSTLSQITRTNAGRLGAAWRLDVEGGDKSANQQGNVIASGGVLYVESTQGSVVAVDGRSGAVKWRYKPGGNNNLRRGVALGEGKVFTTQSGARVVALDQQTGAVAWEKDFSEDRSLSSFPTAVTYFDGMIYFGSANGQRGAVLALSAATGDLAWKVYGIPAAGEFGADTWAGESGKTGGAAPWAHPAIDPELGLVYITFGNARGRPLDGTQRAGQNLFANSIVALNAKTGQRVWHFQSVHHDIWDMDNVMAPVLIDFKVGGATRKAVVYGSKTAMLYVLDRATGEPLVPVDEKAVPQEPRQHTWPTQPYPRNQPLVDLCPTGKGAGRVPPNYKSGCLFTPHWDDPVVHYPGTGGGADTSAYSYNQKDGRLYVGLGFVGIAQHRLDSNIGFRPPGQERSGFIASYDIARGRIAWRKPIEWSVAHGAGALTTAGDVLFIGQPDGVFLALDTRNGRELWRFQTGAGVHTSPITYEVDGEQYVAVFAGGNNLPYSSPRGDYLWAFKIGGTVPQAAAPEPPPKRQPIPNAQVVAGSAVNNTITLGRAWNGAVAATETSAINSVAPAILEVPAGTTVTFVNPADNKQERCATQFFEGLFNARLKPGESFTYTFKKPGEYFFNDCAFAGTTGKVVVK